ncbi:MAG: FAD-dependent oxidoreductase [Deltaproteobacteria bacterium]|nr:FAD-dependent oxidoreductase [Deltaproteobacteria bacterium]
MVNLTIDGRKVEVEEGTTVLKAAEKLGIKIPTLCYFEALTPQGACRLCVVEIVGGARRGLSASCAYVVEEGLEIRTDSKRVIEARKLVIELLLLRCPDVPKLQELAEEIGIDRARYERFKPEEEKCILCGLCVRVCQELMHVGAINFVNRGSSRKVSPPFDEYSSVCVTCGACEVVCPTGAINLDEITKNIPRPIKADFDERLATRPSIYLPFPQAVPKVPVIDRQTCMHFLNDACGACESFCGPKAIKYDQEDEVRELDVGSVILAPGFELTNPSLRDEYGYSRYPNVVTSMEFERILSASGPYQGHIQRPSDQSGPEKVAWIQCVGSRDNSCDKGYCSSVCCMYATKEAIIAKEHSPDIKPTIFYMDIRAHGKGFDQYYERARDDYGVRYIQCQISKIVEKPKSKNLIIAFIDKEGKVVEEEFDLVVLSLGMTPSTSSRELAEKLGIETDSYGFCQTDSLNPVKTSRPGVFVCGSFEAPKDIPETVSQASGSAAFASELISEARGTLISEEEFSPERDISGEEPRIGVFVCHCGINIGGVVDVPAVKEYAKSLPHVAYVDENLYTCSQDTQTKIKEVIKENNLNRVVVASCTPRTHEPLFQKTIREAGLNKYLFEMANIRDQCSWVHMDKKEEATKKAKDLVRMAIAAASYVEPLQEQELSVTKRALVVGGGASGMAAALGLADQGFEVALVEKEKELGGNLRHLHYTIRDDGIQTYMQSLIERVKNHPLILVITDGVIVDFTGFKGNFKTGIMAGPGMAYRQIEHGVTIIATGGEEYKPEEYLYGQDKRVMTQQELEGKIVRDEINLGHVNEVVMIQCVGSRIPERPYCSRLCCSAAIKNALKIKEKNPQSRVFILYRDIRTYGLLEDYYTKARKAGIIFIRYDLEEKPQVTIEKGALQVEVDDPALGERVVLNPQLLVLSSAIVPRENEELATLMKLQRTQEGFFLEAHMKLRPVDLATEGIYLCGLAHSPKPLDESLSQAAAAVSRACTLLAHDTVSVGGMVARVDGEKCAVCLTCVRVCPYDVPFINEEGVAQIDAAKCQGCGSCAAECPGKAIQLQHCEDKQIIAKSIALFKVEAV